MIGYHLLVQTLFTKAIIAYLHLTSVKQPPSNCVLKRTSLLKLEDYILYVSVVVKDTTSLTQANLFLIQVVHFRKYFSMATHPPDNHLTYIHGFVY